MNSGKASTIGWYRSRTQNIFSLPLNCTGVDMYTSNNLTQLDPICITCTLKYLDGVIVVKSFVDILL